MNRLRLLALALLLATFTTACSLIPEPRFMRERRQQKAACEQARKYGWRGDAYKGCKLDPEPKVKLCIGCTATVVAPTVGAAGRRAP